MSSYTPRHAAPSPEHRPHRARKVVAGLFVLMLVGVGITYALMTNSIRIPLPQAFAQSESQPTAIPGDSKSMGDGTNKTPIGLALMGMAAEMCSETAAQAIDDALSQQSEEWAQARAAEEAAAKEQARKMVPATIDVMMIGDILMHDELVTSGNRGDGTYDFGFLFDHIRDHIDACNLRMLNQETVMGPPERGYSLVVGPVGPIMNTPTALADTEAALGFNLILKSSNHVLDQQYEGLAHELDYWRAAHPEIPVIGVNNPHLLDSEDQSQNYVDNVYMYEHDGMKVAVLNYTYDTNDHMDGETDWRVVSYLSEDKVRADVAKAREAGAEMIIACPHWGIQYDTEPSQEEMTYSKLFCELGVDVIFGCHPHILQRVEMLQNAEGHKTVCFYSMGNFVAAGLMETQTLLGGVARVTLQRHEDGTYEVSAASLHPTVICYTTGPNMTAWPILQWNNDLAAQSFRSDLTVDYAQSFCSQVLGPSYDPATGVCTVDVHGEARTV